MSTLGEDTESIHLGPHRQRTANFLALPGLADRIVCALESLRALDLNLPSLLYGISWNLPELEKNHLVNFERTSLLCSDELPMLLRRWHKRPKRHSAGQKTSSGRHTMEDFALELTKDRINSEIRELIPILSMPASEFSRGALLGVDANKLCSQTRTVAPFLWEVLRSSAYTSFQEKHNSHKSPDNVVFYMINTMLFTRSPHNSAMHKLLTMYLKACSLPAKAYDTLHAFGITMSQKWTYDAVDILCEQSRTALMDDIQAKNFIMNHDNVNISFRVQEQRVENQSHFDSGTAATIYIINNPAVPKPDAHAFQEMRREGVQNPISYNDILKLELDCAPRLRLLAEWLILQVLVDSAEFNLPTYERRDDPVFARPTSRLQMPRDAENAMHQYMLPTIHQEEASYEGNDRVVEWYWNYLQFGTPEEQRRTGLERVVLWVGDQLTTERLRILRRLRAGERSSFDRFDWVLPSFGWFHLVMTLVTSLFEQYLGSKSGLLISHAAEFLGRKGLNPGTQGTFHHTAEEILTHTAHAHFRDLWLEVSGTKSLEELRTKSPEVLHGFAQTIWTKYSSTLSLIDLDKKPEGQRDEILRTLVMWNRDILDYFILDHAIQTGDLGAMEDMLPRLLFRFQAGGHKKYAIEVLELLQGLNREWPDDVKAYVRQGWLINNTGRADAFKPLDQNQEHNVRDIKSRFAAIGPGNSWEYIGRISPAIPTLRDVQDHVQYTINPYPRYKKHTSPDAEKDIKTLCVYYTTHRVHRAGQVRKASVADTPRDLVRRGAEESLLTKAIKRWVDKRSGERCTEQDYTIT